MSALQRRLRARHAESGFTLIELLVTMALLVIALPLAGLLLQTAVESERDVRSVNAASTTAQAVVASVEAGVRNAAALNYSRHGSGAADELLVVRTGYGPSQTGTTEATTWVCRAWYYDAAGDVLYTRTVPASGTAPVLPAPTSATLTAWSTLATDVTPRAATGVTGLLTPTAGTAAVDLEMSVATGSPRPAVTISTTIARRLQTDTKGTPCF